MLQDRFRRRKDGSPKARRKARAVLSAAALALVVAVVAITAWHVPTAHAAAGVSYSVEELAFVQLLNDYRASKGLEPLAISDTISQACDRHNSDMAKYGFFDHYTETSDWFPEGATPSERMIQCGYDYKTIMGENLAGGCKTAAEALTGWKNSPTHRAIMLRADLEVIGVSFIKVEGSKWEYYWTTEFGGYSDSSTYEVAAGAKTIAYSTSELPAASRVDRSLWRLLLRDLRL